MAEPLSRDARLRTHCGTDLRVVGWRGEGSFARVYEAITEPHGTRCALKLAKEEIPESGDWLRHEITVLDGPPHPHLVRLLGSGDHHGQPFLALEWLEGETLREHVQRRRRLPLRRTLELLLDVWTALQHLHDRQQCHGDVQPNNVLVTAEGRTVLTDPGLRSPTGQSPCKEADIQASGHLLYLALTGEWPGTLHSRLTRAAGFNRDAVALWEATQSETPPAARNLADEARRLLKCL